MLIPNISCVDNVIEINNQLLNKYSNAYLFGHN